VFLKLEGACAEQHRPFLRFGGCMKRHPAPRHAIADKPLHLLETYQPELFDLRSETYFKTESKLNDNTFNLIKMRWFNTFEVAQFFRFIIALNWLREYFSKSKANYRVLVDFGCSRGQLYTFWRNNGNYFGWPRLHYYGVDADHRRLEPQLPHKANDEYHAVIADLGYPLKMPEKADAIVAMEVLEHIPMNKASTFMKNIYNNLKSDGIAILSSPNPDKNKGEQWAWKDSESSHHYEWEFEEFREFAQEDFIFREFVGILPRKPIKDSLYRELKSSLPFSFIGNMAGLTYHVSHCRQWMALMLKTE
jgi:2-polyprenyl-3-methyl-5-hydroxy-6-metoxy-1,4-benzoquinol methylase